jgi:hypothetical protein
VNVNPAVNNFVDSSTELDKSIVNMLVPFNRNRTEKTVHEPKISRGSNALCHPMTPCLTKEAIAMMWMKYLNSTLM